MIALLFIIVGVAVIGKASITYFVDGSKWREIGKKFDGTEVSYNPKRGNIYSSNYELMATTEERYRLYIDFWGHHVKDSLNTEMINRLANELSTILPDSVVRHFKSRINSGLAMRNTYDKKKEVGDATATRTRKYRILNQDVDYRQLKQIRAMRFFKNGQYNSGLIIDPIESRTNPYGTLALRTIGGVYGNTEVDGKIGRSGLEFQYDSLLRGTSGVWLVQRIDGKEIKMVEKEAIEGKDIVSTIDIDIQELAERALLETLKEKQAESGTAIVMEVETGYIKAIANMGYEKGRWAEHRNYAVSYLNEPGSTFKVVSMMIALEDGLTEPNTVIETGNGVWSHKGIKIEDHNSHRGGYGTIDAAKSIVVSSNIGIAKIIYNGYDRIPDKFMEGIMKTGAFGDLQLEIPGYAVPRMRKVKGNYWSSYSLEKMSYGYENQIPPINILTFFNGLANGGEVIKPLFVQEIMEGDKVVERKKKVVINPEMCSSETLNEIKQMLYDVVNDKEWGTGKPAKSQFFSIAGKTSTAQILGPGGALLGHQVGFCGYFPAEKPKYSCIVTVRRPKEHNPSGGRIAGGVFKQIAEGMYARNFLTSSDILPIDSIRSMSPVVKASVDLVEADGKIPNVKGMGARDAIFALEDLGLSVSIRGKGAVKSQSIAPGSKINVGQNIVLHLE